MCEKNSRWNLLSVTLNYHNKKRTEELNTSCLD